jgi:amidase
VLLYYGGSTPRKFSMRTTSATSKFAILLSVATAAPAATDNTGLLDPVSRTDHTSPLLPTPSARANSQAVPPPSVRSAIDPSLDERNERAAVRYSPLGKSLDRIENDLASGKTTSVELTHFYLDRVRALNPQLHAVISINPDALPIARTSDQDRRRGRRMGPLAGIPIMVKDTIETADRMPTTAGSLALKDNMTGRDAPLVAKLKAAGAIMLGKTNLSEWANGRASNSLAGWSGMGGQTRNPYALDRSPCGSSSGSGVATAAQLSAASVGVENDGSLTCPASMNGVVGLKPTLGLVSRTHMVPLGLFQDTAGPMTRSVSDAARMLGIMAGSDPLDPVTAPADANMEDYSRALNIDALRGVRVGVLRFAAGFDAATDQVFDRALTTLRDAGAKLVEINTPLNMDAIDKAEGTIFTDEFKCELGAYLASVPVSRVPSRTLKDVITFDEQHPIQEMSLFGQNKFEALNEALGDADPRLVQAKIDARRLAGPEGIDRLLTVYHVAVLVAPTVGPAWLIDPIQKDHPVGKNPGKLAAVAGYPHLTVPMGEVRTLPVGLSFIGTAWSDARILAYGFAFEQAAHASVALTSPYPSVARKYL